MNKLLHYTVCFFRIIKKNTLHILKKIKVNKQRKADIKKCKRLSKRCIVDNEGKNVIPLDTWLKDEGRLCEKTGFLYEISMDLTIIIPMYNVERYIVDSIQSVLQQKTKYTYEVLLVDDGSTDGTLEKIAPFLSNERVILLKQENQGQSVARNCAIQCAKGRYVMMLDGDDVLVDDSLDVLMDTAEQTQSDIVEGGIARFQEKLNKKELLKGRKVRVVLPQKNPAFILTCYGYSVAKVYRRELWETLRYPEGYIFEDVISKFILRRKAKRVAFIDYTVYGYRWNPDSSSHNKNHIKKLDSFLVLPKVIDLCKAESAPFDDSFYLLCLNHIGLLNYITTKPLEEDQQRSCFEEMYRQLIAIREYRPKKMPVLFVLLERAILRKDFEGWKFTAETIHKYGLLKKYREIN